MKLLAERLMINLSELKNIFPSLIENAKKLPFLNYTEDGD